MPRFDEARNTSFVVVTTVGGPNSVNGSALSSPQPEAIHRVRSPTWSMPPVGVIGPADESSLHKDEALGAPFSVSGRAPLSPQLHANSRPSSISSSLGKATHHVKQSSCPSGETSTGSDTTRNDKHGGVIINGNDCPRVQIIESERQQVGLEAEPQPRRFACSVGDCRRRYRNRAGLRTSSSPLRLCSLILSSCSPSLSAFRRPRRYRTGITHVRAAQMVAEL